MIPTASTAATDSRSTGVRTAKQFNGSDWPDGNQSRGGSTFEQRGDDQAELLQSDVADADTSDPDASEKTRILLDALSKASAADFRDVRIDLDDQFVRIAGRVASFYHKQLAQETLRPLLFGLTIRNELVVDP